MDPTNPVDVYMAGYHRAEPRGTDEDILPLSERVRRQFTHYGASEVLMVHQGGHPLNLDMFRGYGRPIPLALLKRTEADIVKDYGVKTCLDAAIIAFERLVGLMESAEDDNRGVPAGHTLEALRILQRSKRGGEVYEVEALYFPPEEAEEGPEPQPEVVGANS
jgi:hypothetical protein